MSAREAEADELPLPGVVGAQTVFVALGNVFALAVGLPLQIYVSRTLGSGALGVYGLLEAGFLTTAGFLSFGIGPTVVRFIPEHLARNQFEAIRRLLRLATLLLFALGVLAVIACVLGLGSITQRWPVLTNYRPAIMLMSLIVPLTLLMTAFQHALRGFQDIRYMVAGSSFLQLTVKASVTVVAFALGYRLVGYAAATVLGLGCACVWMLAGVRRETSRLPSGGFDERAQRAWIRYAWLNYANSLVIAVNANLDRFLLGAAFGPATVGVLLVAGQLQSFPVVFYQMLLVIGAPMFASAYGREDKAQRQHLFVLITDWIVRLSFPLTLFLTLFAGPLLSLYGRTFADNGRLALQIMTIGQFAGLLCGPNVNLAMMSGIERQATRLLIGMGVASAGLMILLAPLFGLVGAAIASAMSTVAVNLCCLMLVRRELGVHWWDSRYLRWIPPALTTAAGAAALRLIPGMDDAWKLGGILVALYLTFASVNLAQGLHVDDRDFLRHILERVRARRSAA